MIVKFSIHSLHLYYTQAAYGGYIFEYAVKNQAIEISSTDGAVHDVRVLGVIRTWKANIHPYLNFLLSIAHVAC